MGTDKVGRLKVEMDAAIVARAKDMVRRHIINRESLAKIAKHYGVSRQRVRQIINKAQREGI